jgi:hypothetical protein
MGGAILGAKALRSPTSKLRVNFEAIRERTIEWIFLFQSVPHGGRPIARPATYIFWCIIAQMLQRLLKLYYFSHIFNA